MQRCTLHQLEWGRVYLAVVEVDLLIKLHLFPLSNLPKNKTKQIKTEKDGVWGWEMKITEEQTEWNKTGTFVDTVLYSTMLKVDGLNL